MDRIEGVSKRQIARTLGVDEKTIRNDVADKSAPMPQKPNERRPPKADVADKSALALSGDDAAKAVRKAEQRAESKAKQHEPVQAPPLPAGKFSFRPVS